MPRPADLTSRAVAALGHLKAGRGLVTLYQLSYGKRRATMRPIMLQPSDWPPARLQALRRKLKENTATFGERFGRSPRAVEDWEQGRRAPDGLIRLQLDQLVKRRGWKV